MRISEAEIATALASPFVDLKEFRRASIDVSRGDVALALQERYPKSEISNAPLLVAQACWDRDGSLVKAFCTFARQVLRPNGNSFDLREDRSDIGREILRWRYFSLALAPGMYAAAAWPYNTAPPLEINVLPRMLAPSQQTAHLHFHAKAGFSFETLWAHLASRRDAIFPRHRRNVTEPDQVQRSEWERWIRRAQIARRVLWQALSARNYNIRGACDRLFADEGGQRAFESVMELMHGNEFLSNSARSVELRRLAVPSSWSRSSRLMRTRDVWSRDPLGLPGSWPEGRFLLVAFNFARDNPGDELSKLFVQYLRVRSMLYEKVTFHPLARGMSEFLDRFGRLRDYRGGMSESVLLDESCRSMGPLNLRSIEPRGAPCGLRETKARIGAAESISSDLEIAWVVHFIRDEDCGLGYRACQRTLWRNARRFCRSLSIPKGLHWIRGVDVAGDERRGPLWLLVPVLRYVRAEADRLAARQRLPSLQMTLHVGEVYDHLLSGLRAVHEPILWELMRRDDRLGHAIALGKDVSSWCDENETVKVRRIDRMFDLAWVLHLSNCLALRLETLNAVRDELSSHMGACWKGMYSIEGMVEAYAMQMGTGRVLAAWSRNSQVSLQSMNATEPVRMLLAILDQPESSESPLFKRIGVRASIDRELMERAQEYVRHEIARWGLAIEVNPTSNLLIAGLQHPLDQPAFRVHPLEYSKEALPVAISADDPLTFATTLADEYAYAWSGMVVRGGVDPERARAWLEHAASTSWRSRFSLPRVD